jgi:hypothetical protein
MAQKTDSQLLTEAGIITNETLIGANTAVRVGSMFNDTISSKINNDKISNDTQLGNDPTLVPTQNAVKTYVDAFATGLLTDNGNYDPTITGDYPTSGNTLSGLAVQKGDLWYISADGTMNGNSVLVGYSVRALINNAGATNDADWSISNVGLGFVPENVANKDITPTLGNSDILYPSQNAVKIYVDNAVQTAVPSTAEIIANKSQDITLAPTSTVLYPCNNAVVEYVTNGVTLQTVTDAGNTTSQNIISNSTIESTSVSDGSYAYLSSATGSGGAVGIRNVGNSLAEIKATNLTANRTHQLPDADGTVALLSDISGYKEYIGIFSQTSTSAPTINVINNTLGGTLIWSRNSAGNYTATLASTFTARSIVITMNQTLPVADRNLFMYVSSTDTITVLCRKISDNSFVDFGQSSSASIEIRVYP